MPNNAGRLRRRLSNRNAGRRDAHGGRGDCHCNDFHQSAYRVQSLQAADRSDSDCRRVANSSADVDTDSHLNANLDADDCAHLNLDANVHTIADEHAHSYSDSYHTTTDADARHCDSADAYAFGFFFSRDAS